MALTSAKKRANQKYVAKTYEQLKVLVKKGQKEVIKDFAHSNGLSINAYVNKLIKEDMERNNVSLF